MKKALITLFAFVGVASATPLTFDPTDWTKPGNYYTLNLGNEALDFTQENWTFSITLTLDTEFGTNNWGSTVIATGTEPFPNGVFSNGLQFYVQGKGNSGDRTVGQVNVKGSGLTSDAGTSMDMQTLLTSGTYTFTVERTGDSTVYSVTDSKGALCGSKTVTASWDNVMPTSFVTSINDTQLNNGWTLPSITFTTPVVPEPATATLSLLALCGLAARRRRK